MQALRGRMFGMDKALALGAWLCVVANLAPAEAMTDLDPGRVWVSGTADEEGGTLGLTVGATEHAPLEDGTRAPILAVNVFAEPSHALLFVLLTAGEDSQRATMQRTSTTAVLVRTGGASEYSAVVPWQPFERIRVELLVYNPSVGDSVMTDADGDPRKWGPPAVYVG